MSNGFLAFLLPRNFEEKIIATLDGGNYCHVELMFNENPDGTWKTLSALPTTGVRVRDVTLNGEHWVKIPVEVNPEAVWASYKHNKDKPYDRLGTLKTRFSWLGDHKNGTFYTKIVAEALQLPSPANWGMNELYKKFK